MNLINMKTGERVCSSSSKHDELLQRYRDQDENYREATRIEYDVAELLFIFGFDKVRATVEELTAEHERLRGER